MISNKNTACRFVNLAQQLDIDIYQVVDFGSLKIHRPEVVDNIESKLQYFENRLVNGKVEIGRVLEDGFNVGVHFRLTESSKSTINIHVYRFNDAGKLVELWTNTQNELPARADGTTMLNGSATIDDLEKTEQNRAFTNDIYENVMVRGQSERISDFFVDGKMLQHNMMMENDLAGMGSFLQGLDNAGRHETINAYELCVCEGNFSITATNANFGTEIWAFFDIQRWENGKVAEHWDVIEPMQAPEDWKNNFGKFNFFKK